MFFSLFERLIVVFSVRFMAGVSVGILLADSDSIGAFGKIDEPGQHDYRENKHKKREYCYPRTPFGMPPDERNPQQYQNAVETS